jgi:biotin carboxyl carrier protein
MKLTLEINGRSEEIEIQQGAPECRFQVGTDAVREALVEISEPGVYAVLLDGRSYDVYVEPAPGGGLAVDLNGHHFEIAVRDPRAWSRNAAGHSGSAVQSILSPMPGKVVRVLVAAGDEVVMGQAIVVVEAMKMQNELKANRAGKVLALPAKEGATVAAGELLATIE